MTAPEPKPPYLDADGMKPYQPPRTTVELRHSWGPFWWMRIGDGTAGLYITRRAAIRAARRYFRTPRERGWRDITDEVRPS